MKLFKKLLLAILIAFIVVQIIQPALNKSSVLLSTDITKTYQVPDSVQTILKTACYDCHSNNTNYPWYISIQPVGWFMANHIKNGKADLNFSEFGSYTLKKQRSKLNAIEHSMKDGTMPLSSYTLIHKNAALTQEQKNLIIDWSEKEKDSLVQKLRR